jgi:hypothetical protein
MAETCWDSILALSLTGHDERPGVDVEVVVDDVAQPGAVVVAADGGVDQPTISG